MHVRLNGKQFEEAVCFNCVGSHVAEEEGYEKDVIHRMNGGNKAWEVLKTVLCNRGLGVKCNEVSIKKE